MEDVGPPPSGTFDWLLSFRHAGRCKKLMDPRTHNIPFDASILLVGNGYSTMPEDLWEVGYRRVHSNDIEPRCIEAMRARNEARHGLSWEVRDACCAEGFPGLFRMVIDKGTLDAVMCTGDEPACRLIWNISRALHVGGLYVVVTLHQGAEVDAYFSSSTSVGLVLVAEEREDNGGAFRGRVLLLRKLGAPTCTFDEYLDACCKSRRTQTANDDELEQIRLVLQARVHSLETENRRLGLREAYNVMFTASEMQEYAFDDFEGDVAHFWSTNGAVRHAVDDSLSVEECINFLRAMR